MTDKQILLVRMRITHLSLRRSCLSGSTLWWEKTPSSHCVGSVSNPLRVVGVTQKMYMTTNLVQHMKVKHSEQTVCRVWEGTGERRGGQRQGKSSSVADVVTSIQWASSDMGYKQSLCTIDSSASDWDDSTWSPAILYSGGSWFLHA